MSNGNFNINLVNKLGTRSSGNKSSVKNRNKELRENTGINNIGKQTTKVISSVTSGSGVNAIGMLKGGGAVMAAIATTATIANKGVDLYINYQTAKTGQTLHYSNIKASKNLLLSLGTNYISGLVKNEIFNKNIIKRQNATLEYNRQLYNYNNQGEKYKTR